jgi:hypothetical protein
MAAKCAHPARSEKPPPALQLSKRHRPLQAALQGRIRWGTIADAEAAFSGKKVPGNSSPAVDEESAANGEIWRGG